MKRTALVLVPLLALAGTQVFAAGDLTRKNPEEVVIEMSTNAAGMYFKPNYFEFETGKAYKLVLRNTDVVKHEVEMGEFGEKLFTRKVEIADEQGNMLAEIKGTMREIEVGPKAEVEWFIVPLQTGMNMALDCALPGHKEAGMTATVTIN